MTYNFRNVLLVGVPLFLLVLTALVASNYFFGVEKYVSNRGVHILTNPNPAVVLISTTTANRVMSLYKKTEIKLGNSTILADVADRDSLRQRGLSGRSGLADNQGMLFVFDKIGKHGFWMKDMNFSIDILWISEDKRILDISLEVSPKTYPKVFYPKEQVKYVLELPKGFVDAHNIKIGEQLLF